MKNKFYEKWWFWVIVGIVFIYVVAVIVAENKVRVGYEQCKTDLDICYEYGDQMAAAWNDYEDALIKYCAVDYTNPLCNSG